MSESATERPAKGRNRLVAFALNFVLPPAGYVYAGSVRWALAFLALATALGAAALAWTMAYPPGLYGLDAAGQPGSAILIGALIIQLLVGSHAAVIAGGRRPRRLHGAALWVTAIGLGLAYYGLALAMRAFYPVSFYVASSASFEPTLTEGDVVAVRGARALCGNARVALGDVIVHRARGSIFLKRVVAGPGALVEMRAGRLIIDGHPVLATPAGVIEKPSAYGVLRSTVVEETLPGGRRYRTVDLGPESQVDNHPPIRVPAGTWWVLGDNRDNSVDSRTEGPVAHADVCGVAFKIVHAGGRPVGGRP